MIACDLGSNTFRVVEIDCQTKQRVKEFEKIVRTAENLAHSGMITDKAVDRVIKAIKEAKESFDLSSAKAVATAAMRKASNSDEVLRKILKETGLKIEVIDGKKEAFYVKKAVKQYVDDDCIIMDLGGASTEFILEKEDISFDVGIVTMVDKYSLSGIEEGIKEEFKPISEFAKKIKKPKTFVATSGTPTTIASLLKGMDYEHYDYKKINGSILTISDLDNSLKQLLAMSEAERIRWVGVGRDDLIIAGVLMFKEIVEIFGFYEILVIDDGLREGLALSMC
jgi:exopolyphosphatase/guanosine-5'-triphosphate,3'-diphosphate pyrophosphatase